MSAWLLKRIGLVAYTVIVPDGSGKSTHSSTDFFESLDFSRKSFFRNETGWFVTDVCASGAEEEETKRNETNRNESGSHFFSFAKHVWVKKKRHSHPATRA